MEKFLVGITSDVLMSDGVPIFGTEVLRMLDVPALQW